MRTVLICAALAAAPVAHAEQYALAISTVSKHLGAPEGEYNEQNYGLGIVGRTSKQDYWTTGAFRNSQDHLSVYFGAGWHSMPGIAATSAGFEVGAVTGYNAGPVLLYIAPVFRAGPYKVLILPPVGPNEYTTIGLQLELRP